MIRNISEPPSIVNQFVAELRDVSIQEDRLRFRKNMERVGEIFAYEISKTLSYEEKEVETPLGIANVFLPVDRIVIATILRAGLPLQQGLLNQFDRAECAFISAYRKHHKDGSFDIHMEYLSCPDLTDTQLIVCDPMLATGSSMTVALNGLLEFGQPKHIHIVTVIAANYGLDYVRRIYPEATVWLGALDEELTAKMYIVPGLGDAGDLSYGRKLQD